MCEFCVTAHKRINAYLGHQMLSLAEVRNLESKALVKPAFCTKHASKKLKLYCDTCEKTICRDCTIKDHREHDYNIAADVADRERAAVKAVLQETKAKAVIVEEGLKKVKGMESRVEAKIVEVSNDVDVFFEEEVRTLEEMRATLKHEVRTQAQLKLEALGNQEEKLKVSLAQIRDSINFAEKALIDGSDVELLSIKQQLIQRLAHLNASQFRCMPCAGDYLKLQMEEKRVSDIGKMMTLIHSPDTSKCVLSMVGGEEGVLYQTFAGQPVDMKFAIAGDTAVMGLETGFIVHASVKRDDEQESQDLPVLDKGDGSYFFSYQPQTPGIFTLSVTVEGESVHGSPFTWEVFPELKGPNELKDFLITQRKTNNKMHSWKLKYLGSTPGNSKVEIGIIYYDGRSAYDRYTWCCQNNVYSRCAGRVIISTNKASITSLQNNDILSVYLNQTANKLVIYNHRSGQSEAFRTCSNPISIVVISPYKPSEGGFTFTIK